MSNQTPPGPRNEPVIVCAIDENYAMCAAIMLRSLAAHLRRYHRVTVYVFQNKLLLSTREKITRSVPGSLSINWMDADAAATRDLKIDGHISAATYYRLQIERALPQLEKVIYLDCDTIVNEDIGLLWDISAPDTHLLATPQVSPDARTAGAPRGLLTYKKLGLRPDTLLFNAGVLVMNLRLWRRDAISARVTKYLRENSDDVLWWDQDGLNAILALQWTPLPYRWNVMTSLFRYFDTWKESPLSRNEYYETITHPCIIHYNSSLKPWHDAYDLPYKYFFERYRSETLWASASS